MTPILTPEPELVQTIREAVEAHKARISDCPRCNPTAKAYALVEAQWVVAGIDKEIEMHPNDKLYALERALILAEKAGEPANVVTDLRELRDEASREARA